MSDKEEKKKSKNAPAEAKKPEPVVEEKPEPVPLPAPETAPVLPEAPRKNDSPELNDRAAFLKAVAATGAEAGPHPMHLVVNKALNAVGKDSLYPEGEPRHILNNRVGAFHRMHSTGLPSIGDIVLLVAGSPDTDRVVVFIGKEKDLWAYYDVRGGAVEQTLEKLEHRSLGAYTVLGWVDFDSIPSKPASVQE